MAEETGRPNICSNLKGYLKEAPFFCKVIELIFCVIAVGLIVEPFNKVPPEDMNHVAVVYTALCSSILINGILILSHLIGERVQKKTVLIFTGMEAILCCAAGLVLIRDWTNYGHNMIFRYLERYSDQMISSGIFAILAALVFAVDMYFLNKYH